LNALKKKCHLLCNEIFRHSTHDIDKNSNYPSKIDKVLLSTAGSSNLKNLDNTKAGPAYCKHFALKWVQQWVKKGLEIKAAISMPPRLKLSMLDRLAINSL
jgi:hypothetical protein